MHQALVAADLAGTTGHAALEERAAKRPGRRMIDAAIHRGHVDAKDVDQRPELSRRLEDAQLVDEVVHALPKRRQFRGLEPVAKYDDVEAPVHGTVVDELHRPDDGSVSGAQS